MQLSFVKYQATGNDFIVVNNFQDRHYLHHPTFAQQLCHRQMGIGGDGILTIEQKQGYDFAMLHYNADGSHGGGLCGNGARAVIHYATTLGLITEQARFSAIDGTHTGYLRDDAVYLRLQNVEAIQQLHTGYYLDNGTRHYVEIVDDVQAINMDVMGFSRRRMAPFEQIGVNLNFVQIVGQSILVRTCECGLDTEPLSCGTGAVASALVASSYCGLSSPITVQTRGGKLSIAFKRLPDGCFVDIYLIGPVYQPFYGVVDLNNLAMPTPL